MRRKRITAEYAENAEENGITVMARRRAVLREPLCPLWLMFLLSVLGVLGGEFLCSRILAKLLS